MRLDEQACTNQTPSSPKSVSSRVLNWVKDRQVHIELPIAENTEQDQDIANENTSSSSHAGSADTEAERQEVE
jgi:hypothetical protein